MEIISWSFSNKRWEERLNSNNNIFEIENPISSELSCLSHHKFGWGLLNIIVKIIKRIFKIFLYLRWDQFLADQNQAIKLNI